MKILRKIDDSYRILIPQEIRQVLNLTKHQEVELTVDEDNNRIILTPIEKRPVNDENEIQPVQKLEQKLSFDYRNTPPIIYYSNKDKDLKSEEHITVKQDTEINEEPTKIDKFKNDDVLQFFTPIPLSNLNDEDFIVIKKDEIKIYDKLLHEKYFNVIELDINAENSGKNGYEHYMLKEINEQPFTVRSTIEEVLKDINHAFGITKEELKNIKNIMMIGCGTAYHATMVAKYWIEEFCNIPCQAEYASEYKYRKVAMPDETLAIFVSQSGETADTVAALEKARAAGFKTVSICNVFASTLARMSDYTFYTKCGSEISVASTKAFTAQLAALFSLSVLIADAVGNISSDKKDELLNELTKLPVAIEAAVAQDENITKLAEKYYKQSTFVFLGRNVNYPIALEGALKLKEITYLQAEGFPAGEIKHGPIALLNAEMPVISIMPGDKLFDKMVNACEEVMARGAKSIAITDEKGFKLLEGRVEEAVILPNVEEYLFPFLSVIALQIFAYRIAKLNNREIDQPRNLAKSVTVE